MFFSQTVRRDDEDDKSDVIGRALGAGRGSFDQRIGRATEGSENDDPLRRLGPVTSHRSSNLKNDQFVSDAPSIGRRISRTLARFLFVLLLAVGITLAWQSFREEAKEVVRTWVPSLGWVLPPTVKLAASAEASPELGQQLKPIALDLALVRRSVEQLAGDLSSLQASKNRWRRASRHYRRSSRTSDRTFHQCLHLGRSRSRGPNPGNPQRSHRPCSEPSTGGSLVRLSAFTIAPSFWRKGSSTWAEL